jgi:AraC-like DNA-binding protein
VRPLAAREVRADPETDRKAWSEIHLEEPWTVDSMARKVGLSRSAVAERFTRRAADALSRPLAPSGRGATLEHQSLARIAYEVGYESEAAFNRAFKRLFGAPPAMWRKRCEDPGDETARTVGGWVFGVSR